MVFQCNSCQKSNPKPENVISGGLKLPGGFTATIFAEAVGAGRHIIANKNGDLYVSLDSKKNNGGIAALRDTNNDGKADIIKYFGAFTGTGIDIFGNYLYFGADSIIVRYKLIFNELVPDLNPEIVVKNVKLGFGHNAKTITIDNNGNLFVNIGAPSNACQTEDRVPHSQGQNPCPLLNEFGGIWRYSANLLNQDKLADGHRYSTGLRNCVALRWNPAVNELYAVQHGRDQLHDIWPEKYTVEQGVNLPAEEFFQLKDGGDYGWPYCYYDGIKNKKVLAPEYGGDGTITGVCDSKEKPIMIFPAHYAPNDLLFYTGNMFPSEYSNGAFIAFHGSWNRSPEKQEGYNVVFVPFNGEKPSGNWKVFADGFAGTTNIISPGDAAARPCGLAQGPGGSIYVVEDVKGKIWKISYK